MNFNQLLIFFFLHVVEVSFCFKTCFIFLRWPPLNRDEISPCAKSDRFRRGYVANVLMNVSCTCTAKSKKKYIYILFFFKDAE